MDIFIQMLVIVALVFITFFMFSLARVFISNGNRAFKRTDHTHNQIRHLVNGAEGIFKGQGKEDPQGLLTESGMVWDENDNIIPNHKPSSLALGS